MLKAYGLVDRSTGMHEILFAHSPEDAVQNCTLSWEHLALQRLPHYDVHTSCGGVPLAAILPDGWYVRCGTCRVGESVVLIQGTCRYCQSCSFNAM